MKGLLTANLKAHGARYRATAIAVALATAFILTAFGLTGAIEYSARMSVASEVSGAQGIVYDIPRESTDNPADKTGNIILNKLEEDPAVEVETIYYESEHYTTATSAEGGYLGIAEVRSEPFHNPKVVEGKMPSAPGEIAIPDFAKNNLKVKLGDELTAEYAGEKFKLVGTLEVANGLSFMPSALVAKGEIQKLYPDAVPSSLLFRVDGKNDAEAVKHVQALIASAGVDFNEEEFVHSADEYVELQMEDIAEGMSSLILTALVFPGIAAATAIIVISTTFQVMLAQRKRELALLRAIGADSRQIRSLMIRENLLVGLLSSVIGIVIGAVAATLINKLSSITPTYMDSFLAIPLWGYVSALAIGVLITLIAGIRPALQAGSLSPMVALAPVESEAVQKNKRFVRLGLGIAITVLGGAITTLAVMSEDFGIEVQEFGIAFLGGLVTFVGALTLLTWLVPYITRGVGKLVGKGSVTFQMAGENTWRNPARTGATGTALILGVTLVTMMMVGAKSVESSILTEIDQKRPIDFVISTDAGRPLTDSEIAGIRETEGVEQVVESRAFYVAPTENPVDGEMPFMELKFIEGKELSGVAHSPVVSPEVGKIGVNGWLYDPEVKTLTFGPEGRTRTFQTEVARTPDYTLATSDFEALRDIYGEEATDTSVLYVRIKDDLSISQVIELTSTISEQVEMPFVEGSAGERAAMLLAIRSMLIATIVMLAVSVLVALVGVTNTLALSVVERKRENAMLRALGMTKGDLRRMITWETVLMAGISIVIGSALGIGFGALGLAALPLEGVNRMLIIPWGQVGAAALIALIAALLASIMPARQAAKASPVGALADVG
ncbi:MAG: FtsX-like permease family protein [Actinomycetaceae bacterium]|nr:FtsX-like permease family protein [Actinomycetaceae bacterium]